MKMFWYIKFYNTNYQPDDHYSDRGFMWISSESPSKFRNDISQ